MRASAPAFSFAQALRERQEHARGGDVLVLNPKGRHDVGIAYRVRTPPHIPPSLPSATSYQLSRLPILASLDTPTHAIGYIAAWSCNPELQPRCNPRPPRPPSSRP